MKKTEKRVYVAPFLTVVDFKTEHGYAESLKLSMLAIWQWSGIQGGVLQQKHMENYTVGNNWSEGTNAFWN